MMKVDALKNGALLSELKNDNKVRRESKFKAMCDPRCMADDIDALIDRIENLKAERDFNSKEHTNHLNEIWAHITDGLGDWEYPGQIMRRAKEIKDENSKLKVAEFNRTAGELSNDTKLCRKCNTAYTNHLSGICFDCRKKG